MRTQAKVRILKPPKLFRGRIVLPVVLVGQWVNLGQFWSVRSALDRLSEDRTVRLVSLVKKISLTEVNESHQ